MSSMRSFVAILIRVILLSAVTPSTKLQKHTKGDEVEKTARLLACHPSAHLPASNHGEWTQNQFSLTRVASST